MAQRERVLAVLSFTALLYENTYSRHVYNSLEHVVALLEVSNLAAIHTTIIPVRMYARSGRRLAHVVRV